MDLVILYADQMMRSHFLKISDILNIADSFLGLSIIAIGTSLPEIVTSIRAAKKKNQIL